MAKMNWGKRFGSQAIKAVGVTPSMPLSKRDRFTLECMRWANEKFKRENPKLYACRLANFNAGARSRRKPVSLPTVSLQRKAPPS